MKPIRKHVVRKLAAFGLLTGCLMGLTACHHTDASSSGEGRAAISQIGDTCEQYGGHVTVGRNGLMDEATINCAIPFDALGGDDE